MPDHEEHCQHSLQRYGVRADDIHSFLDEPSKEFGPAHREFRHDSETVELVGEMFGAKYGCEVAENVALDHIMLDHAQEIQQRKLEVLKCPNCGGPIDISGGVQKCRYCDYLVTSGSAGRIKLPAHGFILRYREPKDDGLPSLLPPIETYHQPLIVDEIYANFSNREEVEFLLETLGYTSITTEALRQSGLTDDEIVDLIVNARSVTFEQIKSLLEHARQLNVEKESEEAKKKEFDLREEKARAAKTLLEINVFLWVCLSMSLVFLGEFAVGIAVFLVYGLLQYLLYLNYKRRKREVPPRVPSPYGVEVNPKRRGKQ